MSERTMYRWRMAIWYAGCVTVFLMMVCRDSYAGVAVRETGQAGDFPLAGEGRAAAIVHDEQDYAVVGIAARCLAGDIQRVTGIEPPVQHDAPRGGGVVIIGSLDRSRPIRAMIAAGKLEVADLQGQWECFKFAIVDGNLVIVGSDRRGAAYGVFELSREIGVSPWSWWADVPPEHRAKIHVGITGASRVGPPSVKYRGIFINDEDWGLQPWAAKTYEPETGDIGPRTYARVFELLLRLRANYCWPAMHDCTRAFNHYPRNKEVADEYAIVMGSSHCEQMLRNNVSEWPKDRHKDWNPITNLPEIIEYWETRIRENGRFENVYTVGMRGIHDSGMPGEGSPDEKRERMQEIISLQRQMLARHVNADPSAVPQIFCPYKEVLEIYRNGLDLPQDITIVWPDDNFGYVRQLPDERERQRSGGHGIYYHLSYWGRPHDYLWLDSTSPALIWHEMTKAFDHGAQRLWVVNVGDIKPIEAGMTLFLEIAWNRDRYGTDVQQAFLRDFYTEQFGERHGSAIAAAMGEYFRLCAIRRPEHMGFNRVYPNGPVQDSGWSEEQASRFLDRWRQLSQRVEALEGELPESSRDAYFQLVKYPACAAAAMVDKILMAEAARKSGSDDQARRAEAALRRIEQLTGHYNTLANGKWQGMMNHRPRKLPIFDMPPTTQPANPPPAAPPSGRIVIEIDATKFARSHDRNGVGLRVVDGLGPRGAAIALFPRKNVPTLRSPREILAGAPVVEYALENGTGGEVDVVVEVLPTHCLTPAHELLAALSVDDGEPVIVRFDQGRDDEKDPTWQANVLRGAMLGTAKMRLPRSAYTLKLWAADAGVVVQQIAITAPSSDPGN